MKKILIATLLALSAVTASAVEIGVNGSYDFGVDRPGAGITIGSMEKESHGSKVD